MNGYFEEANTAELVFGQPRRGVATSRPCSAGSRAGGTAPGSQRRPGAGGGEALSMPPRRLGGGSPASRSDAAASPDRRRPK
eukprot:5968379-Alexandrium_andersonii.AAC.1